MLSHRRGAVAVLFATLSLFAASSWSGASAQSAPSGSFVVDGKAAALTQVRAIADNWQSGKRFTLVIFTTKDSGRNPRPAMSARFGNFGDSIIVEVFDDGTIYNADLVDSAFKAPNGAIKGISGLTMKDFSIAGGEVSGHLVSNGTQSANGQKWQVDLTFKTKAP